VKHFAVRLGGALCAAALCSVLAVAAAAQTEDAAQALEPTDLLVTLRTEAGAPIAGQEVFVVVSDGAEVTEELTGTTSDDGELRFEGVSAAAGYTARPIAVIDGFPYQGDRVALTPGVEATLPLTIFDVSDAPVNLHIEVLHIIINVLEPGVYQALQVMSVLNTGDRAAFSEEQFQGQPVGIVIPLPTGASTITPLPAEVSGLDPAKLAQDGNRMLDLRPAPPGSSQVAVQYEIVTDPDGGDVEIVLPYPTAQVSLLIGPGLGAVTIESDQLEELETVEIPGQGEYANFGSDVFASAETLRFRLGPPSAPLSVGSWALLGLAAALLAGAAASIFFARGPGLDPAERPRLLAEVARLDGQHAGGALSDADYHALRSVAITRLMEIDGTSDQPRDTDGE